jgi:hypothetical protein
MVVLERQSVTTRSQYLILLLLVSVWFGLVTGTKIVEAQSPRAQEYLVKLGYLYNFAKFVEWPLQTPANDKIPISICILGKNPFGPELASVQGKTAQERPLEIRRLQKEASFDACHILFIAKSERQHLLEILAKLESLPVLTVSDMPGFAQAGGMVGLVEDNRRIVFEINLPNVQKMDLTISAQLLKLATIVGQ